MEETSWPSNKNCRPALTNVVDDYVQIVSYTCTRCTSFIEKGDLVVTCPALIIQVYTSARSEGYEVRHFAINCSCPAHAKQTCVTHSIDVYRLSVPDICYEALKHNINKPRTPVPAIFRKFCERKIDSVARQLFEETQHSAFSVFLVAGGLNVDVLNIHPTTKTRIISNSTRIYFIDRKNIGQRNIGDKVRS